MLTHTQIFLTFILISISYVSGSSIVRGSCSQRTDILSVCDGIVDYDFFIPPNSNISSLESFVLQKLKMPSTSLFPLDCMMPVKSTLCLSVFVKCPDEYLNSNSSGYEEVLSDSTFPKPCIDSCLYANQACFGLPSFGSLGFDMKCTTQKYVSRGVTVDPTPDPFAFIFSSDSNTCYGFNFSSLSADNESSKSPTVPIIPVEPILDESVCSGVFQDNVLSSPPPGSLFYDLVPPIMPKYYSQRAISAEIESYLSLLPAWMSAQCYSLTRTHLCSMSFMTTEKMTFSGAFANAFDTPESLDLMQSEGVDVTALVQSEFYLPRFPNRSICELFKSTCSSVLSQPYWQVDEHLTALLSKDCDFGLLGMPMFPDAAVVVNSFHIDLSGSAEAGNDGAVVFKTAPEQHINTVAEKDYVPLCPTGFVVPEDPLDEGVEWVDGSGCAVPCRSFQWTEKQWEVMDQLYAVLPTMGVVLGLLLLINWLLDRNKRKQYMLICFLLLSLTLSGLQIVFGYNHYDLTCKSNAVRWSAIDGLNSCTIQSVAITYVFFAFCLGWVCLAGDIYLKVVFSVNTHNYYKIYLAGIFLLPLLPTVALVVTGEQGYSGDLPFCWVGSNSMGVTSFLYPPSIIGVFFAISIITRSLWMLRHNSIWNICRFIFFEPDAHFLKGMEAGVMAGLPGAESTSGFPAVQDGTQIELKQSIHLLRLPLVFMISFFMVFTSFPLFQTIIVAATPEIREQFGAWIVCVFSNDINSASAVCGNTPYSPISFCSITFMLTVFSGHSILLAILFWRPVRITHVLFWMFRKVCGARISQTVLPASLASGNVASPSSRNLESARSTIVPVDPDADEEAPTLAVSAQPSAEKVEEGERKRIRFNGRRRRGSRDDQRRKFMHPREIVEGEGVPNSPAGGEGRVSSSFFSEGPVESSAGAAAAAEAAAMGAAAAALAEAAVESTPGPGEPPADPIACRLSNVSLNFPSARLLFSWPLRGDKDKDRETSRNARVSSNRSWLSSITMSDFDVEQFKDDDMLDYEPFNLEAAVKELTPSFLTSDKTAFKKWPKSDTVDSIVAE